MGHHTRVRSVLLRSTGPLRMDNHNARRRHRRKPHPETTLDPEEQDELAVKLRYGIGLEALLGERLASEARSGLPARRGPDWSPPEPAPPSRPDAEIRARAAALGVTAGRRGQWIRR